ncbi:hypothetical protein [Erysipelatoclostridium sp. An173]|uniref:hypothetical protein n=1 Tax=Erysipelatoclostridium sp. An173 TaxID=1965571 RepID=UPI0032090CF9
MKKLKIILSLIFVLTIFTGCQNNNQDSGYNVIIDDSNIITVNHNIDDHDDFFNQDFLTTTNNDTTIYSNDDMVITVDSSNLIQEIVLKTDHYQLDNGAKTKMNYQDICDLFNQEYYSQIIKDQKDNVVSGQIGITYNEANIKVVYDFNDNKLDTITISPIFTF